MRVADVERASGLSRHTLRFYEARGLIAAPQRAANNYRIYPPQVLEQLAFIRETQGMGFSLEEIGDLLRLRREARLDCAQGALLLQGKLQEVEQRLRQLRRLRNYLRAERDRLRDSALAHGLPLAPELQRRR